MSKLIKHLFATGTLALAAAFPMQAQTQAPILEFHTQLYDMHGDDHSFSFQLGAVEDTYVDIDFGYGPMEYKIGEAELNPETGGIKGTTIVGKVGPEGIVRVYGEALKIDYLLMEGVYADELDLSQLINLDILNVSHNELAELDLSPLRRLMAAYVDDNPFGRKPFLLGSNHPDLAILSMDNVGSLDQSFTLTDYPNLQSFTAWHTLDLFYCDPTQCPKLLQLSIDSTNVETLDVSQNPELRILNIGTAKVTEIDLSNNLKLQQLYCDHQGVLNNEYKIKSLDVSMLEDLQILFAAGNMLTDIDLSGCPLLWELSIANNYLSGIDLSGNPDLYNVNISTNNMDFVTLPAIRETYGDIYFEQRPLPVARSYPVGAELDLEARLNRPGSTTSGKLICNGYELSDEYYTYSDGLIEFYKATPDSVYLEFTNSEFFDITLKTNNFIVKEVEDFGKDNAVTSWRLKPSAKNVNLTVGIAGASAEHPVRYSVDFGDGNIQDFTTTTNLLTETPMMVKEKQGNGMMTLYLPEGEELTAFAITETPLSTINLAAAHSLRYLDLHSCSLSDIDLRWNHKLLMLNVNDNALETLDLSGYNDTWNKVTIHEIYANDNELTSLTLANRDYLQVLEVANNKLDEFSLSKFSALKRLNLSGNLLTSVNLQDCEGLSYMDISNNDLASLYIPEYTPLETLNISSNRFPMSTLPVTEIAEYIYAPQKEWMLPAKAPSVNLTEQEVTINGNSTEFKWFAVSDGHQLTSAEVESNGAKFKFVDTSVGEVYATWTNAAFPDFKGDNVYRTQNLLAADAPSHVAAKFTTTEAVSGEMSLRSSVPGNFIYIDWSGDGDYEQYALNHETYKRFPIDTYENAEVKVCTYDEKDGISVFSIDNIPMSKIDLSNMTDVLTVSLDNCGLTPDVVKLPNTELTQLSLSDNPIAGIDLSAYTELYSLRLQNCGYTEFDASPFKKLGNFVIDGNSLTNLTLDNPALWNLFAAGCDLESLDLSKVPLLQQAYIGYNKLTTLDVSMLPLLKVLEIPGNCFTLTTLPRVLSTYSSYNYANQALYPVTVKDGCIIDLSDQLMVGTNRTNYRWFRDRNVGYLEDGTIAGDELVEGTEYTEDDGVFTFFAMVKDAVCVMTNQAFPGFIFLSEPIDILGSGVEGVSADRLFSVAVSKGTVAVIGAEGMVSLYAADGRLVSMVESINGTAHFDGVTPGIYIVANGSRTAKVLVK